MLNKINIALVGSGNMAKEHARAFQSLQDTFIKVVYSRNLNHAQKLASEIQSPNAIDQIEKLRNIENINLIIVAVSIEATYEIIKKISNMRIPILVEKPLGLNLEECKLITKLTNSISGKVLVALNRRCYSSTLKAQKYLSNDHEPRLIEIFDQQDKLSVNDSNFHPKVIKNWMFANSIHLIDYAFIFGRGKLKETKIIDYWNPSDNNCFVTSRSLFSSGDIVYYRALWGMPGPWGCAISTKNQRLEMSPLENLTLQKSGSRKKIKIKISDNDVNFKPGFRIQAEEVVKEIKSKKPSKVVVDANQTMETTKLISKIYKV